VLTTNLNPHSELFVATRYPQLEILNLITQHHGHDIVLALKVRFRKWPASAAEAREQKSTR
jgi:hypothetical protein